MCSCCCVSFLLPPLLLLRCLVYIFMIYLPLPPPLPLHLLPARCYIQTTGGYDLLRTKNFCTNLLYKKRTFHLLVSC